MVLIQNATPLSTHCIFVLLFFLNKFSNTFTIDPLVSSLEGTPQVYLLQFTVTFNKNVTPILLFDEFNCTTAKSTPQLLSMAVFKMFLF